MLLTTWNTPRVFADSSEVTAWAAHVFPYRTPNGSLRAVYRYLSCGLVNMAATIYRCIPAVVTLRSLQNYRYEKERGLPWNRWTRQGHMRMKFQTRTAPAALRAAGAALATK